MNGFRVVVVIIKIIFVQHHIKRIPHGSRIVQISVKVQFTDQFRISGIRHIVNMNGRSAGMKLRRNFSIKTKLVDGINRTGTEDNQAISVESKFAGVKRTVRKINGRHFRHGVRGVSLHNANGTVFNGINIFPVILHNIGFIHISNLHIG